MASKDHPQTHIDLQIYDSQTHSVRKFEPIEPGLVKMYVCGPTVYDDAHVGHARSQIVFDVIRRVFEYFGYRVFYVSNYTDIDDKMINRAAEEGISVQELAKRIIRSVEDDFRSLNIQPPTVRPKATEHIDGMVQIVQGLINKGYAYAKDSGVYFRVQSFPGYGTMTNFKLEDSQSTEDDGNPLDKEHRADFALMKKSKEGEPFWETPWGKMRPGWHIECSAMSMHYLGETFDIHGGGQDLAFPHHVNEIAQSEAYTGKKFSNFFIHHGFLTTNKEKMSKSLKNFFTIKDVLKKYDGDTLRFFMLQAHYRKPLEYATEGLEEAQVQVKKFKTTLEQIEAASKRKGSFEKVEDMEQLAVKAVKFEMEFVKALANDFNTPDALSTLYAFQKEINKVQRKVADIDGTFWGDIVARFKRMLRVLGLSFAEGQVSEDSLSTELMDLIINIRQEARKRKDWETADQIRDQLKEIGIVLEDVKGQTVWKKA
ncbi:MAG: cysteine--tRNA ligase [Methanobacteriota archaeon]|nr:MAG: cysteine--tRNA ligase [Euryarchaeota archaeon]